MTKFQDLPNDKTLSDKEMESVQGGLTFRRMALKKLRTKRTYGVIAMNGYMKTFGRFGVIGMNG
jgi:bacteriocin-like protein